jgi:hypothetical protein
MGQRFDKTAALLLWGRQLARHHLLFTFTFLLQKLFTFNFLLSRFYIRIITNEPQAIYSAPAAGG